jgi:Cytochrome c554 and c-prime
MLQLRVSWLYLGWVAVCAAAATAGEIRQNRETGARFVGSVGCQSSSCHGGAGVKRSQYITWSQQDFHARAYAILLDARSARIAEAVGIDQAQSSARCTICHSPFQCVPPERLESSAHPDEGVSCENCHGAAERWLRGHTRNDWTYAMRVTAGMRDLRSLYVRANTCVACHQNIDSDLLGAGHPVLVFELDSQSINEPKHWRDDHPWHDARAWLVGQAVALREISWALTRKSAPPDANRLLRQQGALVWLLGKTGLADDFVPDQTNRVSTSDSGTIQRRADEIARRGQNWNPNPMSIIELLRAFATDDAEFRSNNQRTPGALFPKAERIVLALGSLTNAVNGNRATPLKIDIELNQLRDDVRLRETFDAARFAAHLRTFRAALAK